MLAFGKGSKMYKNDKTLLVGTLKGVFAAPVPAVTYRLAVSDISTLSHKTVFFFSKGSPRHL